MTLREFDRWSVVHAGRTYCEQSPARRSQFINLPRNPSLSNPIGQLLINKQGLDVAFGEHVIRLYTASYRFPLANLGKVRRKTMTKELQENVQEKFDELGEKEFRRLVVSGKFQGDSGDYARDLLSRLEATRTGQYNLVTISRMDEANKIAKHANAIAVKAKTLARTALWVAIGALLIDLAYHYFIK